MWGVLCQMVWQSAVSVHILIKWQHVSCHILHA